MDVNKDLPLPLTRPEADELCQFKAIVGDVNCYRKCFVLLQDINEKIIEAGLSMNMEATESNLNTLIGYLQHTLSPDPSIWQPAEKFLESVEGNKNYPVLLLRLVNKADCDLTIRVASAITFKKYIKKNWKIVDDTNKIHDEDRETVKSQIVGLMLRSPEQIQRQLSDAVSIIGREDFPEKWQNLLQEMISHFQSGDFHVINRVLHTTHSLFKRYRYKFKSQTLWIEMKFVLDNFAKPFTDLFVATMQLAETHTSNVNALKVIFSSLVLIAKVYYSLNFQDIQKFFGDNLKIWMPHFLKLLTLDNELLKTHDPGLLEQLKSQICEIIGLYAQKFHLEFFKYLSDFVNAVWSLLTTTGQQVKYDLLVSNAIHFLSYVAEHTIYKHAFEGPNVLSQICEKIIIPNMKLRDVDTRRRAACDLVKALAKHFESSIIQVFPEYVNVMLQKSEDESSCQSASDSTMDVDVPADTNSEKDPVKVSVHPADDSTSSSIYAPNENSSKIDSSNKETKDSSKAKDVPIPVQLLKEKILVPGELVWVQVGKFPYWPAMISYDPKEGRFTKLEDTKKNKRLYHVQYFGPRVQHGWACTKSLFLYEGENKFHIRKTNKAVHMNKMQFKTYFFPNKKVRRDWNTAIMEADVALSLDSVMARYGQFVFKYKGTLKRCAEKHSMKTRRASDVTERCGICGKGSIDVLCKGLKCKGSFHRNCLGLSTRCMRFNCVNCELGISLPINNASSQPQSSSSHVSSSPSSKRSLDSSPTKSSRASSMSQNDSQYRSQEEIVEKAKQVVDFKQQAWLDEKRKKVLDTHIIEEETEKYLLWLTQVYHCTNDSPDSSRPSSPLPISEASFKEGLQSCFVCKKVDTSLVSCVKCSYLYHYACLPHECCNQIEMLCPRHFCLTCFKAKGDRTLPETQCFCCPLSFHASRYCIPVGSVKLTPLKIICAEHFWGQNIKSPQPAVHISYCVICGKGGGNLAWCASCPQSVHLLCFKESPHFSCKPCEKRQFFYIGMIVWAKTGAKRWWPAKVVDPQHVPDHLKNLEHYDGEFLVQYFGTKEYVWTHMGRVMAYADYDREKDGNHKDSEITSLFNSSVEEAAVAYNENLKIN